MALKNSKLLVAEMVIGPEILEYIQPLVYHMDTQYSIGLGAVPYTEYGRIETGPMRLRVPRNVRNRNCTVVGNVLDRTGRG